MSEPEEDRLPSPHILRREVSKFLRSSDDPNTLTFKQVGVNRFNTLFTGFPRRLESSRHRMSLPLVSSSVRRPDYTVIGRGVAHPQALRC